MAFTTPRNWHGDDLVGAADLNEQIRDNMIYLQTAVPPADALILFNGPALPDGYEAYAGMVNHFWRGAGGALAINAEGGVDQVTIAAHTAHAVGNPATHATHNATNPFDSHPTVQTNVGSGGLDAPYQDISPHVAPTISAHSAHSGQALTDTHAHAPVSIMPPYADRVFGRVRTPAASFTSPRTWVTSEVPTIAMLNQELRDNPNHLIARALDNAALVLLNSGAAPANWHLLDGTGSYYNIGDSFPRGTTRGLEGPVGGAATAAIRFHDDHVPTQAGAHDDHTISVPAHTGTPVTTTANFNSPGRILNMSHDVYISSHSNHSNFGVDPHKTAGVVGHAAMNILPPFLALTHIQLLASLIALPTPRTWVTGEIISASLFNLFIRDIQSALKSREVPIGGIIGWVGSAAGWPANYGACDGTGGRVDTRDKYIMAAGGSHATGTTGGASTVTPAAHDAHVVSEAGNHFAHSIFANDHNAEQINNFNSLGKNAVAHSHNTVFSSTTHVHSGSTVDAHSAHGAITLTPPYHAVAFIQRTS
jgi:hypothetical protein